MFLKPLLDFKNIPDYVVHIYMYKATFWLLEVNKNYHGIRFLSYIVGDLFYFDLKIEKIEKYYALLPLLSLRYSTLV